MTGAIPPASWPSTKRAVCLEFPDSGEWQALILGILKQLSYGYYWDKSASNWEEARAEGLQIVLSFMNQIRCDAGAIPILEPQCVDFPNNSPMLDWQPMNPFLEPNKIPPGYIVQPWGVVPTLAPFPFTAGDVISGLFGLPVLTPALGQGLARCRVKVKGKGTVELHLVKVLLGGMCLITWDDNPLTAQFIDMEWHVISLPPETSDEDINEVTFETDGDHHIDITMLPRFSEEAGFAGYGGGIRKVVLCGPDMQFVPTPTDDGLLEEFGTVAICDIIRFENGKLQVNCCGAWVDVDGQPVQGVGGSPQPGAGTPQPTPGGGCQTYHSTMAGGSSWLLPTIVSTGDTIHVTNASGATNDGHEIQWHCPDGSIFFAGTCSATEEVQSGDPLPTVTHMKLIAYIGSTPYDVYNGVFTVPGGISNEQIVFQVNDDTLDGNSGSLTFDVTVCNNAATSWAHIVDLKVGANGFVFSSGGTFVGGTGLVSTQVDGSPNNGQQLFATLDFGRSIDVNHIKVIGDTVAGTHGGTLYEEVGTFDSGGSYTGRAAFVPPTTGTNQALEYNTPISINKIKLSAVLDVRPAPGATDGSWHVHTLELSGTGFNPFA